MNVKITGRHMEVTGAIKDHVEKTLDKVRGHFDKPMTVDVVLTVEKHRHIADITLNANGIRLHAEEDSPDMYTSVDAAVEKIDRQVRKLKDRRKKFKPEKLADAEAAGAPTPQDDGAVTTMAEPDEPVLSHKIVREELNMKPMDVEEAAMQLELSGHPFLAFCNARTQHVNVLYVREDGAYGLIEPQF